MSIRMLVIVAGVYLFKCVYLFTYISPQVSVMYILRVKGRTFLHPSSQNVGVEGPQLQNRDKE